MIAGLAQALLFLVLAGLLVLRFRDDRADREEAGRLRALQPVAPARFDPSMVAGLPGPARRFFGFAFRPGTPLVRVTEMRGVSAPATGRARDTWR